MEAATGVAQTDTHHNARNARLAKILYPYHPLYGKTVKVFGSAGGQRDIVYILQPNNATRGIPGWMFDEVVCASVRAADSPVIECHALVQVRQLLDSAKPAERTGEHEPSASHHSANSRPNPSNPTDSPARRAKGRRPDTRTKPREVRAVAARTSRSRRSSRHLGERRRQ